MITIFFGVIGIILSFVFPGRVGMFDGFIFGILFEFYVDHANSKQKTKRDEGE